MRGVAYSVLVAAISASAGFVRADEHPCRFSSADMSADLLQLEQSVTHDWAYRFDRRFDAAAVFATARARLPAQADGATFRAILERIVASMKDGHGYAYVPCEDRSKYRLWPFTLIDTLDGVLIDEPDGTAAPLARGDRLVAVDGVSIEKLIKDSEQRTPASTIQYLRVLAIERLRATEAKQLKVSVIDARNHRQLLQLATVPPHWSPSDAIETRDLGSGVSYLRISSFLPVDDLQRWFQANEAQRNQMVEPGRRRIDKAFDEVEGSHALVLDLRGNLGGIDLMGQRVADHLLYPGYVYYSVSAQSGKGFWSAPAPWKPSHSGVPRYEGRVVVLIDERSASAADNLARCLRDNRPNIIFIGRPTAGATGAPRDVTLAKSGAKLAFCTMRVFGPKGALIEGHGVEPDMLRVRRRLDFVRGVDVDMAAALDHLGWKPPSDFRQSH